MSPQRILYIGSGVGTSLHRALALRRMGHTVELIDPRLLLPAHTAVDRWIWRTGGLFLESVIRRKLFAATSGKQFNLLYVDGGELVDRSLVQALKKQIPLAVNYNMDDPYGGRDFQRWRMYLNSLPAYDLVVVLRECNVREARTAGARRVLHVTMSADEQAHAPRTLTDAERQKWSSDVLFVGTWMPERGPFLAKLIALGVPLSIYGNRWDKAAEWPILRPHWRGPGLSNEDDYSKVLQCAKVCLGLLSKGNRDESTVRSFEIPYLGGVLCAERTPEHLRLYDENDEAVFWSTPEECALKCRDLLADLPWRERLAHKSRRRCISNGSTNEKTLQRILEEISVRDPMADVMADAAVTFAR